MVLDHLTKMLSTCFNLRFAKSEVASFRPLFDNILIERIDAGNKTPGGLLIPEALQSKHPEGRVLQVGPGKRDENGNYTPLTLKKGDRVILPDFGVMDIKLDNNKYIILREEDIPGIINV